MNSLYLTSGMCSWHTCCTLLPCYLSFLYGVQPRQLLGQGRTDDQVTEKVDVFSFGICLREIWTLGEQVRPIKFCTGCCVVSVPCVSSETHFPRINEHQGATAAGSELQGIFCSLLQVYPGLSLPAIFSGVVNGTLRPALPPDAPQPWFDSHRLTLTFSVQHFAFYSFQQ